MDLLDSGQWPVPGFCELVNEPMYSISEPGGKL